MVLNDGRPIFAAGDGDRIGNGPWARWLATSIVPDESSPRAERGRVLARTGHVHSVSVERVDITARVIGSAGAEYRVGLRNFYVITRYNRSAFYATAVNDLAHALRARHAGRIATKKPPQSAGK